jgi:cell division septation protein DedD
MGYLKMAAILALALVVISGCSKKKEEAAKLEQEMMAQSSTGDSQATDLAEQPAGDKTAIEPSPVEEPPAEQPTTEAPQAQQPAPEEQPSEQPAEDQSQVQTPAETPPDAQAVPKEDEAKYAPTEVTGHGWTVQVAGCESLKYAQHLSALFTERGYDPYITEIERDGKTVYRVRIGKFEAKAAADLLKAELAEKYSVQAWIDAL